MALSTIGSDLSVSISLQTASELVDAANEIGMRSDELVGAVVATAVMLTALREFLARSAKVRKMGALEASKRLILEEASKRRLSGEVKDKFVEECIASESARLAREQGVLEFSLTFVSIFSRIAFSIAIQLLAASARARQSSRGARIVSLLGLVSFFSYVEASGRRSVF